MSNASTIQGLLATNDDLALKIEQLKKKAKDVGKLTFNEYTIAIGDLELTEEESDTVLEYLSKESVVMIEPEEAEDLVALTDDNLI